MGGWNDVSNKPRGRIARITADVSIVFFMYFTIEFGISSACVSAVWIVLLIL